MGFKLGIYRSSHQDYLYEINQGINLEVLPGMYDRKSMIAPMEAMLHLSQREKSEISLILLKIQLCEFTLPHKKDKRNNIQHISIKFHGLIKSCLGPSDIIAYITHDQFVILLPKCDTKKADSIMTVLFQKIDQMDKYTMGFDCAIQLGSAQASPAFPGLDQLIVQAELNLKSNPKNLS